MTKNSAIDTVRVELLLTELRLPGIKLMWQKLAEQADKEGWPAARFLASLTELEIADRGRRRIERHLADARLPVGKTLDAFDFAAVPMISKAQVMALSSGDGWNPARREYPPVRPTRRRKKPSWGSHWPGAHRKSLARPVHAHHRSRSALQVARRELALESAIAKLDKYHLLVLDDIAYVSKDQAETSVLFELIGSRYERRSMLITANQPFGEWGKVFPDQAMTLAAVDRLVHHATILEMNVKSYRCNEALERKRGKGRPAGRATIKTTSERRSASI